jgi:hypothetical protein
MLKTASSVINAIGALNYAGTWNANTNTPTLTSGVGTKGNYYVVSVAGTTTLDGINLWSVGDWAVFNGTAWQKVDGASSEAFSNITVTGLTGYMYANNTSPVTASLTIPNSGLANSTTTLGNATLTLGGTTTSVGNLTLTNVTISSGNVTANLATSTSIPVANATGTLAVSNGGTGLTSLTTGYIPYGNGTSAFSSSANLYFDGTILGVGTSSPSGFATRAGFLNGTVVCAASSTSYTAYFGVQNDLNYSGGMSLRPSNYSTYGAITANCLNFYYGSGDICITADGSNNIKFGTGGGVTERMRIFASGGVSIGNTTDPGAGNFKISGWIGYDSSDNLNTISNGVQLNGYIFSNLYSSYYGNGVSFSGSTSFAPTVDNLITLGTSSKRWSVVYAATGTINTSDENAKTNIQDSTWGLNFINLLKPKTYLMKDSGNYTEGTVRNKVDENGNQILLSNGQPVQEIVPGSSESIPGKRTHLGLVAQDVKNVLDSLNVDLAVWVNTNEGQGLRYEEFIAPIIKAIQELNALITDQAAEISDLKTKLSS